MHLSSLAAAVALLTLLTPVPGLMAPARAAAEIVDREARSAAVIDPAATLGRAKLAYERGDYTAAILLLRPLLYPTALLADEEQVLLGHKLLGLCYLFERDDTGGEQEFAFILSLRPDFVLDPLLEPAKAVAFVDALRRRNAERLGEVRRRQAQEESRRHAEEQEHHRRAEAEALRSAQRVYVERIVDHPFTPLALLPFGVPQLADHRPVVGGLLLSGEALLGAASLSSWLTVRLRYPDGTFPPSDYGLARGLTASYLATGAVFWGLVLLGSADALIHARKHTRVRVRVLTKPPADLPGGSP